MALVAARRIVSRQLSTLSKLRAGLATPACTSSSALTSRTPHELLPALPAASHGSLLTPFRIEVNTQGRGMAAAAAPLFSSCSHLLQAAEAGGGGSAPKRAEGEGEGEGEDSHSDFLPQFKKEEEGSSVAAAIEKDINLNSVMVYMKGYPHAPMCGFSAQVVRILNHHGVPFASRNVLEDNELRNGIKAFSQWPTIPQVYISGEFVGGCDIMMKMHESGELEALLNNVREGAKE